MSIGDTLNAILASQQEMRREMAEVRALLLSRLAPLPEPYTDEAADPPLGADETLEAALRERAYRIPRRRDGEIVPIGPVEVWNRSD